MSDHTIAEGLARTGGIVAGLCAEMVSGIAPERFGRFAHGADGPVNSNHPAFVVGHLSLYPSRLAALLSLEADLAAPDGWESLFAPGAACVDDPNGDVYPTKDRLISFYRDSHRTLLEHLPRVPSGVFANPTPVERYRERFPTIMAATTFLLVGHAMLHVGQISAWRRFEGMPSLK